MKKNEILIEQWFATLPWLHKYFNWVEVSRVSANELSGETLDHCYNEVGYEGLKRRVLLFSEDGTLLGQVGRKIVPMCLVLKKILGFRRSRVVPEHIESFPEKIMDAIKRYTAEHTIRFVIGTFVDEEEESAARESRYIILTRQRLIISTFPRRYSFAEWLAELERKKEEKEKKEAELRKQAVATAKELVETQLKQLALGT